MVKLIQIIDSDTVIEKQYEEGELKYNPSIKYRYEIENPEDPTDILRYGKYHKDEIQISLVLDPAGYDEVLTFLKTTQLFNKSTKKGLYVQFDHNGSNKVLPVVEIKLPEASDGVRFYNSIIKFTLESRYIGLLPLPEFTAYSDDFYGSGLYSW